ncbi:recombinase [Aliarcobacter cryaerophilus]|nr:integrase arm-type DNA-binding domain-containing protein [Aliarcobacter cryaerophilus]PRM92703.1 recombinase [Aliarcobacter cryaerophilus]
MARLVKPLTDKDISTVQPREKDYKLNDGKGLFVIVKIDGTKYFRFDFSYGGKRKSTSF